MSIIGESIDGEVDKQISIRQNLHGKQTRTNTDLSILNNTNAWLKLASSVRVISQTDTEITSSLTTGNKVESTPTYNPATGEYEEVEENISTGERRLRDIGLDNTGKFTGNQLAKKAVLFNTLSEVNSSVGASIASGSRTSTTDGTYNSRSGVSSTTDLWNNNSYGLGGTDFGLVPAPGLISAKIDCKNRGSIREATVELKAYNLFQFELIELLYLRLGYSMLLEWGWNKYLNRNGALTPMGNTLTEDLWFQDLPTSNYRSVIKSIADYRKIYDNNYDGFLGKVVNFDWSFQPDGTYNITLKLITIGDVIESLKVNLPSQLTTAAEVSDAINSGNDASTILLAGESPIVTNAGSSTLSLDLYNDIASSKPDKWEVMGGNYFSLLLNLQRDNFNVASFNPKKDSKAQFPPSGVDSNKYTYFLTFRTLLDKLNTLCIPSINDGKLLEFDTSGENICSAFPNQVSFNPKICLIKPQYTETINLSKHPEDFVNKLTGVKNNWNALARLKDFFTIEKGTNVLYGNIMDIYLNYDFISNTLQKNTGKGGEISIYKFLEDVCDNINSSLGGINKLEPILEDDNIVKIIDQNPIPGIETSETFKDRFGQTTPFEIYGFSPSGSTSNFVRDFGFKTKIGPELASMITIGAAAQNKSTKNYDGTAFSKWNDGLQDAYAITYDDPKDADLNVTGSNESYPLTKEQLVKMMNKFIKSPEDEYWGIFPRRTKTTKIHGIEITGTKDVEDDPITKRNYSNVTWVMYVRLVKQQVLLELINNSKTTKPEPPDPLSNYLGWLIQAFAGNINGTYNDSSFYFYFNDDFYKIGKELFKGFINGINNEVYSKSRTPSNTIGFIPADLSLTIDGLSGIKIYNALSINQRFLPKQYPLALNFIITKVNHDISSNNWSTSLHSIAVPKTAAFDPSFLSISVSNVISSQQSTLEAFTGPTPNADILRAYLNTIPNYFEKEIREISNGGDITLEAANMAVSVFKEINKQYPGLGIIVTGGNDAYHQNLNSNSIHKVGNGIDFTIHKVTNDNLSAINKILKGFAASNSPNFRYIDEYSKASTNANGAHFHMSYEVGTEAQSALPPSTTTTTSSSEKSTFTYFPEYAKISDIKSGNSFAYTITVTINYDDGKNIGTGVGKSVIVFDNEYAAKASATLKAKQDLTNQFNN